jgi:hypothetical protein
MGGHISNTWKLLKDLQRLDELELAFPLPFRASS